MMTKTASPGDSWASLKAQHEYIVVGAGAAGSMLTTELSIAGAMGSSARMTGQGRVTKSANATRKHVNDITAAQAPKMWKRSA